MVYHAIAFQRHRGHTWPFHPRTHDRRRFPLGIFAALLATGCVDLKSGDLNTRDLDASADSKDETLGTVDVAGGPDGAPDSEGDIAADAPIDSADTSSDDGDAHVDSRDPSNDGGGPDVSLDGGPGDVGPTDSCATNCLRLGDFRCSNTADAGPARQLQVCSAVNGCLQWLDTAACGDNEICCSGACQALTSNASCESDYFVDAQSGVDDPDAGPDRGTEAHPFRTITVAIAEAQRSMTASKRIHVAAGRYDATLGERFPLILRNGVSLFGAGADKVTVQGLGTYDHGTEGGTYADVYSLTILVGDDALPTVVSGMTLRGGDTTPTPTHHGILCDRGSGASGGAAAGATILDNIVVGPNYDNGIVAATSTVPTKSGCNLRMTRSTVTSGTWGVVAVGCMVGVTKVPVAVHIGDETGGNTFRWLSSPTDPTGAILIWPCVTNSSVRHNLISDSGYGVTIDQADDAPAGVGVNKFTIDDNVFTRLTISGVFVWSEATSLEELNDNTFTEISASLAGDMTRVAWGLAADGKGALFPPIKQARRNRFVGNDAAIVFGDSTGVSFGTTGPVDFGRVDDPGGNVFHCNSKPSGVAGDLLISVSGTGAIPFAGNVWDHVPLTTGIDGTAVNGTDVIFFKTPQPALDTTNGAVDTSACPAGRVLGP